MSREPIRLSAAQWQAFQDSLYERADRLERRQQGQQYSPDELVDSYVLSGHAEALLSQDVDGDLWGTLEDLDETAGNEAEAWQKVTSFYLERGCVLVQVTDESGEFPEPEEWIFSEELARRLGLVGA